jgi:hypothetical protein
VVKIKILNNRPKNVENNYALTLRPLKNKRSSKMTHDFCKGRSIKRMLFNVNYLKEHSFWKRYIGNQLAGRKREAHKRSGKTATDLFANMH